MYINLITTFVKLQHPKHNINFTTCVKLWHPKHNKYTSDTQNHSCYATIAILHDLQLLRVVQ